MSVLTIDVGLINLAICCVSKSNKYNIHFWELLNILGTVHSKCCGIKKNGQECTSNASLKDSSGKLSCKVHYKGTVPITRKNQITRKKVANFSLQDIAAKLIECIQDIFDRHNSIFLGITNVLIELQPRVNNKMKFSSHIIYGKLLDLFKKHNLNISIRFVSAKSKLKNYQGPCLTIKKNTYKNRKDSSIEMVEWYLNQKINEYIKWNDIFNKFTKKDDVSDALLYAINFLK